MKTLKTFLFFLSVGSYCHVAYAQKGIKLIDKQATKQTKFLYSNLHKLAENNILFGHQHATEYGHGWRGDPDRSDVKSVTGSHPAVIGVDFSGLSGRPASAIEKETIALRKTMADTYNRGGVVTVAWHFYNPVTPTEFYWKDSASAPAVGMIIPGGTHHEIYKGILQTIGDFAKSVRGNDGKLVPMIFRPFHEFDGYWFWWGKPHASVEEFTSLWKFTVSYLRDSLAVHNFIYAFSPDNTFTSAEDYLERYPGNEWVDMLGFDDYNDFGRYGIYKLDSGIIKLKIVDSLAKAYKKLAALTETGLESVANDTWWTGTLLQALQANKLRMTYVLVWRNDVTSPTHFYATYPGHSSEKDFIKFYKDPYTLFEKNLPAMYKKHRKIKLKK